MTNLKCPDITKITYLLDYIEKAVHYLRKQMFDVDKIYKQTHVRAVFSWL